MQIQISFLTCLCNDEGYDRHAVHSAIEYMTSSEFDVTQRAMIK